MSLVLCLKVDVLLHFLPPPCVCLSHSSAVRSYTGLLCCTFFHTLTLILAPLPLSVSAAVRHTHTLTISSLFFFYFSCISLINNVFCIHESPFPPPILINCTHFLNALWTSPSCGKFNCSCAFSFSHLTVCYLYSVVVQTHPSCCLTHNTHHRCITQDRGPVLNQT